MHGLPLEAFNLKNVCRMGRKFGKVIAIEDPKSHGRFLRNFVRVKVMVEVKKPLITGFHVSRPNLPVIWLSAKYERLQHFCFSCGVLGHASRLCRVRGKNDLKSKYGEWICADNLRPLGRIIEVDDVVDLDCQSEMPSVSAHMKEEVMEHLGRKASGVWGSDGGVESSVSIARKGN